MRRIFVPAERLRGEAVILDGDAHRHLVKVLRLEPGDTVVIFDGEGTELDARIARTSSRDAELILGARRQAERPRVPVTLLQVVPRGERMDLLVQKTTELGIAHIVPVIAERSVARPPPSRVSRWQTIAREAARQCGRADVPSIAEPQPLSEALGRLPESAARFVLWEAPGQLPLRRALIGDEPAIAILVGPEGGFAAEEIEAAGARGFRPVGLGPRILRAETAAIVAVALAQAAIGALD